MASGRGVIGLVAGAACAVARRSTGRGLIVVVLALPSPTWAQADPPPAPAPGIAGPAEAPAPSPRRETTVFYPTLRDRNLLDSPRSVSVITADDIQERMLSRTLPDALKEIPGVSIQKTSAGHGSPFIRGFTGFRNVLLLDGIRLNNALFREGPNQYWNTVDEFLVDRMEVVRGPTSVLYGSDAIGGTVAVASPDPLAIPAEGWGGRTFYRYGSADDSQTVRQEGWVKEGKLGLRVGATYRDFNDVVAGRDTGTQPQTGYDEYGLDAKLAVGGAESRWVFAVQHGRQDDVPRTHRTIYGREFHGTSVGTDLRLLFDQERDLVYAQYHGRNLGGAVDAVSAGVALHRNAEETQRTDAKGKQEIRSALDYQPSVWVRLAGDTSFGRLTYGGEWYRDYVSSAGRDISAAGAVTAFTRGEVPDETTYDLAGAYVQDELKAAERLDLVAGLRLSYAAVHAGVVDASYADDPGTPNRLDDRYSAAVGSLRGVYHLSDDWNLIGGWGMGFRAPTLDDVAAVRLVQSGNTDLPSPGLDPEYSHTFELGTRVDTGDWRGGAFLYYTFLRDFIGRVDVGDVTGDGKTDFVKRNVGDGEVKGTELDGAVKVSREVTVFADAAWVLGDVEAAVGGATEERPLSKVNPAMLHLGTRWEPEATRFWLEGLLTAARHQSRLSPSDETDTQRIPPGGTPGYSLYTLRFGYRFSDAVRGSLALENIADKDYRVHGSGQNEAGTNVVLGIEARY